MITLITGVDHGQHQIGRSSACRARTPGICFAGVVQPVVALELGDDGLFECRGARRSVLGETLVDRRDGGILDMLRRIEVRFAGSQSDDVLALGFQFGRTAATARVGEGLMACTRVERDTFIPLLF